MENFTIETYEISQIFAQQVEFYLKGIKTDRYSKHCQVVNVDEPIGPFAFARNLSKITGIEPPVISKALSGKAKYGNNFRFYYEGSQKVELKTPNIEAVKAEMITTRRFTAENILYNLNVFGFENVEIKEFNRTNTIFTAKCMNQLCSRKIERKYSAAVSGKDKGCCKVCENVVKTAKKPKKYGEKSLFDLRPEMLQYYKAELNDGKQASEFTSGSTLKVVLQCDNCGDSVKIAPHNYTLQSNGKFHNGFHCQCQK